VKIVRRSSKHVREKVDSGSGVLKRKFLGEFEGGGNVIRRRAGHLNVLLLRDKLCPLSKRSLEFGIYACD
jgi:hypothetical protein